MAKKTKEKKAAKKLLKIHSQKEVAKLLNVTEKTVGNWVKEFKEEQVTLKNLNDKVIYLTNELKEVKELLLKIVNI